MKMKSLLGAQKESQKKASLALSEASKEETDRTSLQGYVPEGVTYEDLVKLFGEPGSGDGCKTDCEWRGKIGGVPFTIYNYKTGRNYLGMDEGKDEERMEGSDWHVGGKSPAAAYLVEKFIRRGAMKKHGVKN